jgi:hypothetical protein
VSDPLGPESLSRTTDVVLAIRLVLSNGGSSVRGVVVDPEGGRDRRFVGLTGLCDALAEWLAETQRMAALAAEDEEHQGTF